MDIIGHTSIMDFFALARKHGKISHAYCFVGRRGVGKRTVAEHISAEIFGIETQKLYSYPDFFVLERKDDDKTGKLKKDISINQVREVIQFLAQSSFVPGGKKIVLVDGAELLSASASHAILKTLEEPRPGRIIFLLAENEADLLPTIVSRCQHIFFSPVADGELIDLAVSKGLTVAKAKEMASYAHGLPGKLITWCDRPELYEDTKAEENIFRDCVGKPLYEKLKMIDHIFSDKEDHIRAREQVIDLLHVWHASLCSLGDEVSAEHLISLDRAIVRAKDLLTKNIHPRLLVEQIMLQLP